MLTLKGVNIRTFKLPVLNCLLIACAMTVRAYADEVGIPQKVDLKDRGGIRLVTITGIRTFRHSDYFKHDIPEFRATVRNDSGETMNPASIEVTVHKKDGSKAVFSLEAAACRDCKFLNGTTTETAREFLEPFPYTSDDFASVEISFSQSWLSERRNQLTQRRKNAELKLRQEKAKAEGDAQAAEERRKVRAACTEIYQRTADKKIRDLTVREEQQVRSCQGLGLYPPQ